MAGGLPILALLLLGNFLVASGASLTGTCGLSSFRHVPQRNCNGRDIHALRGSPEQCAAECCRRRPACQSFSHMFGRCWLKDDICTPNEESRLAGGNMYYWNPAAGSQKRMVAVKETMQDLLDVLEDVKADLEETAETEEEARELEDMREDFGLEARELEEMEEDTGMAEDGE